MSARQAVHVECIECSHSWVGLYLPLPISDAARVIKHLSCPMCAATAMRIQIVAKREPLAPNSNNVTSDRPPPDWPGWQECN